MIRLIVTDVDGTLLQNGAKAPSETFFKQIEELRRRGVKICIASGRSYNSLRKMFERIADDTYFICDDGSLTMFKEKEIGSAALNLEEAKKFLKGMTDEFNVGAVLSNRHFSYLYNCPKDDEERFRNQFYGHMRTLENLDSLDVVYKIGFFRLKEEERKKALNSLPASMFTAYDECDWLEFIDRKANKGPALKNLQKLLGISKGQTIAFGDNYNDKQMLQNADYSYFMKTSSYDLSEYGKEGVNSVEETLDKLFFHQISRF